MNTTESAAIPAAKSAAVPSIEFLRDLADVLEKHRGGLTYYSDGDKSSGIYATQNSIVSGDYKQIMIDFPHNGNPWYLRALIDRIE